jgi:hypothetical protein
VKPGFVPMKKQKTLDGNPLNNSFILFYDLHLPSVAFMVQQNIEHTKFTSASKNGCWPSQ